MTPNQLKTFREVARCGSISSAAAALFVSVAAVSASVADLERELGVQLIERNGRGIRLREAGLTMSRYGAQILGLFEEATLEVRRSGGATSGTLRIGAVTTAGEEFVPRWIEQYLGAYPEREIVFEVSNSNQMFRALIDHEVDIVVGGRPPNGHQLAIRGGRTHHLLLVGSPALLRNSLHPQNLGLKELSNIRWLLREEGSGTRQNTDELFEQYGLAPKVLTIDSNRALIRAAELGLGLTVLSSDSIDQELKEGSLEVFSCAPFPLERRWLLTTRHDSHTPRTALEFAEFLAINHQIAPIDSKGDHHDLFNRFRV